MVRFISGTAHSWQLDLCDELGLMVYEESSAGWLLKDSPQMKGRFRNSVGQMILRDRNHPCLSMWGILNETEDCAVFQEAVTVLAFVRSLDTTRLGLAFERTLRQKSKNRVSQQSRRHRMGIYMGQKRVLQEVR